MDFFTEFPALPIFFRKRQPEAQFLLKPVHPFPFLLYTKNKTKQTKKKPIFTNAKAYKYNACKV